MSTTAIASLQSLVRRLNTERQKHMDAIAEIDAAFGDLGVTTAKPKKRKGRPGRPKTAKKKTGKAGTTKGKRRKFRTTASDLVLGTIKKAGAKGATGKQITKAWKAAKRPGDAYKTLGELAKVKKIKREKVKGGQGSRYTVA